MITAFIMTLPEDQDLSASLLTRVVSLGQRPDSLSMFRPNCASNKYRCNFEGIEFRVALLNGFEKLTSQPNSCNC